MEGQSDTAIISYLGQIILTTTAALSSHLQSLNLLLIGIPDLISARQPGLHVKSL